MKGRPAAILLAGAAVAQTAPALTGIGPLRRRLTPALAGLGRPDHVALTFDDGPDRSSTPAFLDLLERLGWRATFFMLGGMVRRDPALAREVADRGHEVAVHGDRHRNLLAVGPRATYRDLAKATDAIAAATGVRPARYRPPYGVLTGAAALSARRLGLRPVLWTAWGRDWRAQAAPASVVADVRRGLGPGGTILLHDSDCTSAPGAWRSALGALPALGIEVDRRGLAVGPLAEHGLPPC